MALENHMGHPRLRSIGAVLMGYTIMIILLVGTFFVIGLYWPEAMPTSESERAGRGLLGALLAATFIQGTVGGYVTATIAKRREYLHGFAVIAIMLLIGLASLFNTTSTGESLWYAISTIAVGTIAILAGVRIRLLYKASRHEDADAGEPGSWHPAYRKHASSQP